MSPKDKTSRNEPLWRSLLSDKPFLIATAVLTASALSWGIAVRTMGIVLFKKGVPWAKEAAVSRDFRLLSLPKHLGRYKMVPGSDRAIPERTLEPLKIGTPWDKMRLGDRKSNWYLWRRYRDTRADPNNPSPYDAWSLQVFFYNGGSDSVPHIPERCRSVGGTSGILSDATRLDLGATNMPKDWKDWGSMVEVQRVLFNLKAEDLIETRTLRRSEYYLFVLNGRPENNWILVREKMKDVWTEYCYFAKVQFGPAGPGSIQDSAQSDAQAQAFLQDILPDLLRNLPSAGSVDTLNASDS